MRRFINDYILWIFIVLFSELIAITEQEAYVLRDLIRFAYQ